MLWLMGWVGWGTKKQMVLGYKTHFCQHHTSRTHTAARAAAPSLFCWQEGLYIGVNGQPTASNTHTEGASCAVWDAEGPDKASVFKEPGWELALHQHLQMVNVNRGRGERKPFSHKALLYSGQKHIIQNSLLYENATDTIFKPNSTNFSLQFVPHCKQCFISPSLSSGLISIWTCQSVPHASPPSPLASSLSQIAIFFSSICI